MPDVRCLSWHSQKPPAALAALRFTPSAATELYLHLRPQTESALEDLKVLLSSVFFHDISWKSKNHPF